MSEIDLRGAPAVLVLENGRVFRGRSFGAALAEGSAGEVVFNTSMTGYQEIVTDPSYAGQIVVMTAPQIGNIGVNSEDREAPRPACTGLVVREASSIVSSWRARGDLHEHLAQHGVAGIEGLDTRALTRVLRDEGAQRGMIFAGPDVTADSGQIESMVARVRRSPSMEGLDLVPQVTCRAAYEWTAPGWSPADAPRPAPRIEHHVVAYDYGIKENILRDLVDVGCRVTVVPATAPAREVLGLRPDGVFLSNGPGDPAAVTYAIEAVRELVADGGSLPLFGICLGHQILGLALGAKTFKLPFGHHGGNHPVKDLATGKVEITAQNHGFAVDPQTLPDGVTCTHVNLYDQTVEGLALRDRPVFSVQYHPEASPGPHDASYLFLRFTEAMRQARGTR
jgi:carbamoyl-phosphate synthase small subunit